MARSAGRGEASIERALPAPGAPWPQADSRLYMVTTCRQLSSCRLYSWIRFTCTSNMEDGLIFTLYSFSRNWENFSLFSCGDSAPCGALPRTQPPSAVKPGGALSRENSRPRGRPPQPHLLHVGELSEEDVVPQEAPQLGQLAQVLHVVFPDFLPVKGEVVLVGVQPQERCVSLRRVPACNRTAAPPPRRPARATATPTEGLEPLRGDTALGSWRSELEPGHLPNRAHADPGFYC